MPIFNSVLSKFQSFRVRNHGGKEKEIENCCCGNLRFIRLFAAISLHVLARDEEAEARRWCVTLVCHAILHVRGQSAR